MNKLIEKVPGSVLSFVYVGKQCLFVFPTNQLAWEQLSGLRALENTGIAWPQEVYLVLALVDSAGIRIGQIGHIVSEDNELKYKDVQGAALFKFSHRVIDDWPEIKEGLSVGKLLRI